MKDSSQEVANVLLGDPITIISKFVHFSILI